MGDMMARGAEWLARQKRSHASSVFEYCRPGRDPIEVAFTRGRTTFEIEGELGFVRVISEDFIGSPEDLLIEAEPTAPQKGDRVIETIGAARITYEVLAPGKQPVWRYTDGFRQRIRIHTKQIKTEPASNE